MRGPKLSERISRSRIEGARKSPPHTWHRREASIGDGERWCGIGIGGSKIVARKGFIFCPNHLKLATSPPKTSEDANAAGAVEHRWYGDVAPWSEEQLEQYCRDMGFSPLQPEENVPTPHDDVGDISLRRATPPQCGVFDDARFEMKEAAN